MSTPVAPSAPPVAASGSLVPPPHPGFGTLLKRAADIWKIQWWRIALLGFLPVMVGGAVMLFSAAGITVTAAYSEKLGSMVYALVPVVAALLIFAIWIATRLGVAQMHLVIGADERIGIQEAWRRSKGKAWSMFWIGLLSAFVLFGGYMLLLVPGIILSVSIAFASWALVRDGLRGRDALVRSAQLVKGDWWWTAISGFVFVLFLLLISVPVFFLEMAFARGSTALLFTSFLRGLLDIFVTGPLALGFSYAMYESLAARKSGILPEMPNAKLLYAILAALGTILPFLMAALMVMTFPSLVRGAFMSGAIRTQLESGTPELDALMETEGVPSETEEDPAPQARDVDSDGDGLLDETEASLGLDPVSADSDGDGLADGDEQTLLGTHATNADTDGDGYEDGDEILAGFSPSFAGEPLSDSTRSIYASYLENGRFREPTATTLAPLRR